MPLRLRSHLHWCICGGRVVFLDLATDRYFYLAKALGEAFIRLARGAADCSDLQSLKLLVERRLIVADANTAGIAPACSPEPVTRDILENDPPASISLLLKMFKAELQTAHALKRRTLLEIVEARAQAAGLPSAPGHNSDQRLRDIATASRTVSLVLRAADRCLVRALAVHKISQTQGLRPTLLFGVRMDPFGAHAWVQDGGAVVVGDYEQVRLYTPILAVG